MGDTMKKSVMFLLLFVFLAGSVYSVIPIVKTRFNPFSGRLDYISGGNFSGGNISADHFFGNNSQAATFIVAANNSLHKSTADYICDGIADDLTIEQAMDDLPSNGGKIHLLEGTYITSGDIDISTGKNGIMIEGEGQATVIEATIGQAMIEISEDDITIKDIKFDGKNIAPDCYRIRGDADRFLLTAASCYNADEGVTVTFATASEGLRIEIAHMLNAHFTGNIMEDSSNAIFISLKTSASKGNVISENTGSDVRIGIQINDADDNVVSDNTIVDSVQYGILLQSGADDNLIGGNVISGSGDDTLFDFDGILVQSNHNVIGNNRFKNSARYGVHIDTGVLYNIVANNNIFGSGNASILDNGINTTIIGNYPGGSSMEIQTVDQQDIKMKPHGKTNLVTTWTPGQMRMNANISNTTNIVGINRTYTTYNINQDLWDYI
jgi:parallel beta-helix repeat protein